MEKTTFIKMFEDFIRKKKEKYEVLSINAWESDFYGEPVVSILSEFADLESIKNRNKEIKEAIGKVLMSVNSTVIQSMTGINLKEIKDSLKNETIGENVLSDFKKRKEAIREVKRAISNYTGDEKKLLIIVDELDRTRPDYAVRFLEDMKHFFDIKNVVFLVAVNRKQISATVKRLYGEGIDFDGYYRRFFKQEINLPDPHKESINLFQQQNQFCLIKESYIFWKVFGLTLRDTEYFFRIFNLIFPINSKSARDTTPKINSYSFYICLFIKNKEAFQKILKGVFTVDDFIKLIDQSDISLKGEETQLLGRIAIGLSIGISSIETDEKKIKDRFGISLNLDQLQKLLKGFPHDCQNTPQASNIFGPSALYVCEHINRMSEG